MRGLIFHSLQMRRVMTLSIVSAVAVSVAVLFALGLLYGGVQRGVRISAERGGAEVLVVPHDAAVDIADTALLFTGAPAPLYLPKTTADDIASVKGVGRTTEQFFSQTLNASCCSTTGATRLIGVDFATDWTVQPFSTLDLSEGLGDEEVIVGSDVGGAVGEPMSLLGRKFTIVSKLESSGSSLDGSILLDVDVARSMSFDNKGLSYLWDKYGNPDDLVSCVLVDLDGTSDPAVVLNRINAMGGGYAIQRSNVVEASQKQLESVFMILLGAGVVMLASTLIQLFARFYSSVWERKSELALYCAVGANRSQVRMILIGEVAFIVGTGSVVGLGCGAVLYAALTGMLKADSAFPFVSLGVSETAMLVAIILSVLAGLALVAIIAPLAQLNRLDPSLAMQQGDIG